MRLGTFFATLAAANAKGALDALSLYFMGRPVKDIQFADQAVRLVIDRLEADRPASRRRSR